MRIWRHVKAIFRARTKRQGPALWLAEAQLAWKRAEHRELVERLLALAREIKELRAEVERLKHKEAES